MAASKNTLDKALAVNLDDSNYGTFAEIGAGQEVARNFFLAGRASKTVAKTMSAYDMTFSDAIYGKEKSGRYVCESRLMKMLKKEYELIEERLKDTKGSDTKFFAFANTVATSKKANKARCHGWMGVRFQTRPGGPVNDIVLHVRMKDTFRLPQQQALGILGVNLIYATFYERDNLKDFVASLLHSLSTERIEVDMIRFSGEDLAHVDNRLLNLELVEQRLSPAVMFDAKGEIVQAAEVLFKKPVVIQRGTFRPVTITNEKILDQGLKQMKHLETKPLVLMEISMTNLNQQEGQVDSIDFLDRVDTLTAMGHNVLISKFELYYELKEFLRECTSEDIQMLIGATALEKLFDPLYYENLEGGTLYAFGKLFDSKTKMFVYPFKSEDICHTTQTFNPDPKYAGLFKHLLDNENFIDIGDCDDVDTGLRSEKVRDSLTKGTKEWESMVPKKVRDLIIDKRLFGYNPED